MNPLCLLVWTTSLSIFEAVLGRRKNFGANLVTPCFWTEALMDNLTMDRQSGRHVTVKLILRSGGVRAIWSASNRRDLYASWGSTRDSCSIRCPFPFHPLIDYSATLVVARQSGGQLFWRNWGLGATSAGAPYILQGNLTIVHHT